VPPRLQCFEVEQFRFYLAVDDLRIDLLVHGEPAHAGADEIRLQLFKPVDARGNRRLRHVLDLRIILMKTDRSRRRRTPLEQSVEICINEGRHRTPLGRLLLTAATQPY
jgi:hypothetical protein